MLRRYVTVCVLYNYIFFFFFFFGDFHLEIFWRIIKIKPSNGPAMLRCHEANEDQVLGHLAGSATNQSGR